MPVSNPPLGTVTFIFTDIQSSADQRTQDPSRMQVALRRYEEILRDTIEAYGGYVYKIAGQTSQSAFSTATQAVQAALAAQQAFYSQQWDEGFELRVKMA